MKKRKLLKNLFTKGIKTVNKINHHKHHKNTIESSIKKAKNIAKNIIKPHIMNNSIANKISNEISDVLQVKKEVLWDLKKKKEKINNNFNDLIIKLPDYSDYIFSLNLKNITMDAKWRRGKIIILKLITKTKIIKKISKVNFELFHANKITEREFISNFYFTSFFEIMYGNPDNVIKDLITIRNKLMPKMYQNWYIYVYGRMYYYSLLKWNDNTNPLMKYILSLNNEIFLEIKTEIDDFMENQVRWNYYQIIDLTFANSMHPLLRIKRDKNEFALSIYEILKSLKRGKETITLNHLKYLQFLLPENKYFMDFIVLLNVLSSVNSYFFYEYTILKGNVIESILGSNINDNFDYLLYGMLFSIFSEDNFYYNLDKIEKILNNLKMNDSDIILIDLGKEIKNIRENLIKRNKRG